VTYGLIELGRNGWTDAPSLAAGIAGVAVIVGFFLWERFLTARPGGRPLIDLTLFESRGFTWGVILAALGGMALIGMVFTLPQYNQGVLGLNPEESGVRLLPIIAGLIAGAVPADRVARRVGARYTVAVGFVITAIGLLLGSRTQLDSTNTYFFTWMAIVGFGMGVGFATAASAALKEIPSAHSGVASALLQAMQKVGAPFGSAVLGSVLVTVYQSHLSLTGLPNALASTVKLSVFAGIAVAGKLHSATLLESVRYAFVQGMDAALLVSAAIATLAALLALIFLPGRSDVAAEQTPVVAKVA
jgi:Na+/melibiose symporter-like transporter